MGVAMQLLSREINRGARSTTESAQRQTKYEYYHWTLYLFNTAAYRLK